VEERLSLIFVSGGVRSGKSSFAEELAIKIARQYDAHNSSQSDCILHYIAAGQASDEEMKARIAHHQRNRNESKVNWKTWEQPIGLKRLEDVFDITDVVLLDCLTTLLNNEFFREGEKWRNPSFQAQLMEDIIEGIEMIVSSCQTLIIVSNEVFYEPYSDNELTMIYKKMLGKLHQKLVRMANRAYLVEVGIPILMKGDH